MIIFSLLTFSTGNLLIIPYRLIKFQVHWSRHFGYFGDTSSMQKFKGNYLKKKVIEKQRTGTGAIKRQIPLLTLEKSIHIFFNQLSIMPELKQVSSYLIHKCNLEKKTQTKTLNQTNFPLKTSQGHLLFIHSAEQAS